MNFNPSTHCKIVPCHSGNQTASANGKSIDTLNLSQLLFVYQFGTTATGTAATSSHTVAFSLEDSADDSSFAAISGATTGALICENMDAQRHAIRLTSPHRRYVRAALTVVGTVATGATGPLNNGGCLVASLPDVTIPTTAYDSFVSV